MSESAGPIGRRLLRVEDRPLLVGAARFVDDACPADALHVAFVRSPLAHARIAGVDLAAARAAPGVAAVVSAEELSLPPLVSPCETPGASSPPRPLLAAGRVRFAGEPVAAVAAESRYLAEDAAELVELELEPLAGVVDALLALEPGAPLVHDGDSNLYLDARTEVGDVDGAFAAAAAVVELELRHGRVAALPIEPRGLLAEPDGSGLLVTASTQGPHKLRLALAEVLGLPLESVRVVCADVGGGFGQKAHVHPEELVAAALALRLGRPVAWSEDRAENLVASTHARDQHLRVRAAAAADGTLLALDVAQVVNQGAYPTYPHGPTLEAHTTSGLLPGPYRLGALRVHSRAVATNTCPQGAYRGVGFVVAAWTHERVVEATAGALGLDPADVRRRNLIGPDELPYRTLTNQTYDSGDYARALEVALAEVGRDAFAEERLRAREAGRLLGLGVCCYVEPTGMNSAVFKARGMVGIEGFDGARIELSPDGTARVWTTTPAIGQGSATTLAQLAAAALGLEPEAVTVQASDTAAADLAGTGTFASRSAVSAGGAVDGAGAELRRRLLEDAAARLGAAPDDLELVAGAVRVSGAPQAAVALGELVAAAPERYRVEERYDPPAVAYAYAAHACVVEVEADTGGVRILRYVVVEDCGRVVNPLVVEGQVHGATAQGIGEALLEVVDYDAEGQPRTASLAGYLVPTAAEIPALEVSHLETPSPFSAHGVKGVGEGGTVGAPAAVANAVCDAVGAALGELPLRAEVVREAARRALL